MSTPKNAVNYFSNALTISVPTNSPASLHELLMKGINTALSQYVKAKTISEKDIDGLVALSDLQSTLIPTEHLLEESYQVL